MNSHNASEINLVNACIWIPVECTPKMRKVAGVLAEEIASRSSVFLPIVSSIREDNTTTIVLSQFSELSDINLLRQFPDSKLITWIQQIPDGFQISTLSNNERTQIYIIGADVRGTLYGAGYLLRKLHISSGVVYLSEHHDVIEAPKYPLRGHQLGYRDKTNSYDGWDLIQWDRYIRELALFGTNAIELIPPRSDDLADSVNFPLPPLAMMAGMSKLADDYGLDVWIWYPALDEDYSKPEMVQFALDEWSQIYKSLVRIDAIMVPGGDPGNSRPTYLLPMLQKQVDLLHRYHPQAQMWISPQGFNHEWMVEFITILQNTPPGWLYGVVYGPWIHMTIQEFRTLVPAQFPLRNYPDITHSLDCQYPVPQWDIAFALTEGRETINPRPLAQATIFCEMKEYTMGFISYSEGCNDDVNKFIWSALGWDPELDVVEILRQYSRLFIGDKYVDAFAIGLLALERNWDGPLAANDAIEVTLLRFQTMESLASPSLRKNWRFQQALYRAYYDAYIHHRLLFETSLEIQAIDYLVQAKELGALQALRLADEALAQAVTRPISIAWKVRIHQLAEALFQSVHMQLSVPRYAAQSETRGANLDGLDFPLNDRPWLTHQFENIRSLANEQERLKQIDLIVNWKNAGADGYYLDLSNTYNCPFIENSLAYEDDPSFYRSPHRRFPYWKDLNPIRKSWRAFTGALNDNPFCIFFPTLDRKASYQLRVVYSDTEPDIKIRLTASNGVEIHPFLQKPNPRAPMEFNIPREATCQGELRLRLCREPGKGGLGAGHEISEIWVIKNQS